MPPTLILLCGLPCTGKTWWRKNVLPDTPFAGAAIISTDDVLIGLREHDPRHTFENAYPYVREMMEVAFQAALTAKQHIVVDRTNISSGARRHWITSGVAADYAVLSLWFEAAPDIMERRRVQRTDQNVPRDVFEQMWAFLARPSRFEGIDFPLTPASFETLLATAA